MTATAFHAPRHTNDIRIYVACLAAYNNGILHGHWINADQDADDIRSEIAAMLKASPISDAEEYAIHDCEGFESVQISEYRGIDEVAALADFIAAHGELGAALFTHYGDIDAAETALEDDYCGAYSSVAEYAEQLTEDTVAIPECLRFYIDYEAIARDMMINDLLVIETDFESVHVFRRC